MSEDKTYNGYTNYETWNCALWLDNDQGTNELMREEAERLVGAMEDVFDADEVTGTTSLMGDFVKQLVDDMEEFANLPATGLFADLLQGALREIDYYDIAESQMADALREAREKQKPEIAA